MTILEEVPTIWACSFSPIVLCGVGAKRRHATSYRKGNEEKRKLVPVSNEHRIKRRSRLRFRFVSMFISDTIFLRFARPSCHQGQSVRK